MKNLTIGLVGGVTSLALIFGTNYSIGGVFTGVFLGSIIIGYLANKYPR